jgi:hypothetical protein
MENIQSSGECAYCGEESDRLFEPPIIQPVNWSDVEIQGDDAWWICPKGAYRGKDLYDVICTDWGEFLRPYETPDEPICWLCYAGHTGPSLIDFCINAPKQVKFNGWHDPEWLG